MAQVKFDDFQKMDIRIGTVVKAEVPEWSHWVIKLTVDFGPAFAKATAGKRERTIFAGVLGFYKPEYLEGKQFPFIVNLEPKKIGPEGDYSQGMMLAGVVDLKEPLKMTDPASAESFGEVTEKPVLLNVSEKVPDGTRVR